MNFRVRHNKKDGTRLLPSAPRLRNAETWLDEAE